MVVKYTWLKELDALKRRGSRVSVHELRTELDTRGFRMPERELMEDLQKLQELGLVESDLLVTSDGTASVALDDASAIAITAAGLRKLSAIVKI